jgi:hypothetical protein
LAEFSGIVGQRKISIRTSAVEQHGFAGFAAQVSCQEQEGRNSNPARNEHLFSRGVRGTPACSEWSEEQEWFARFGSTKARSAVSAHLD